MSGAQDHPLVRAAALPGAAGWELVVNPEAGVVRLRHRGARLWCMVARENGSMWDRWSDDEGLRFVMLTDAEAASGPKAIAARLAAAAAGRE